MGPGEKVGKKLVTNFGDNFFGHNFYGHIGKGKVGSGETILPFVGVFFWSQNFCHKHLFWAPFRICMFLLSPLKTGMYLNRIYVSVIIFEYSQLTPPGEIQQSRGAELPL